MQEILQLYVADVYQTSDILGFFDLNENHKDQKLKSPQSKRLVPIHHTLLDLGFLEFLRSKGSGRLFEDAPLANDGTYSSSFSKWLADTLSNIGIKTDKTSFHSLRHNMKDFFRVGESMNWQKTLWGAALAQQVRLMAVASPLKGTAMHCTRSGLQTSA